ncbi:MAG: hypothetical protein DKINENOH_03464 [bacterium]|nr:hypothetical protein [bacterium]
MMQTSKSKKLALTASVKQEIGQLIDTRIREVHVTREDFSELKAIVKDLAVAQERTEQRLGQLTEAQRKTDNRVEQLAEAQQRTEQRLEQLAEAQQRTEQRLGQLAEAQQRTEQRLEQLAEAQQRTEQRLEQLAEAQQRTEQRLEQLAEAQQRTEQRLEQLAEAQRQTEIEVKRLAVGLNETRNELGGLARSFGYAFENEAFRMLPPVLLRDHGITIKNKIIRAEVGGKEINLLSRGEKDGREVMIVGEAKLRLDERRESKKPDVFDELEEKVQAVLAEFGPAEIVKVLITHYATRKFLDLAREKGIIVVQSFEW